VADSDVTNPYTSINTAAQLDSADTVPPSVNWSLLILLPFGGLILGTVGYIAAPIFLENRNVESEPVLSYGQQAGLISTPLCAVIAAMIGLSIALVAGRQAVLGTVLLFFSGSVGGFVVNSLWTDQIAQHGRDYSEIVLYYPPMVAAAVCWLIAIPTCLIAFKQHRRST